MAAIHDKNRGLALLAGGTAAALLSRRLNGTASAGVLIAGLGSVGVGLVLLARGAARQVGEDLVGAVTAPFRPPAETQQDLPQVPQPAPPEPGQPTLPFNLELTGAITAPANGGELDLGVWTSTYQVEVEVENHTARDKVGVLVLEVVETARPFGAPQTARFRSAPVRVDAGRRTRATINAQTRTRFSPSAHVVATLRWDDSTRHYGSERWLATTAWSIT